MKSLHARSATFLLGLTLTAACQMAARAELYAYEGFDYQVGQSLAGANGGAGWGTAWDGGGENGFSIAPAGLTYAGLGTTGYATAGGTKSYRHLANAAPNSAGTTLWASALLNQGSATYANFGFYGSGSEMFSFGDTYTGSGPSPNYSLYIAGGLTARSAYVDSGVPIATTGPQLLVTQMDIHAGGTDIYFYLNPAIGTAAPSTADAIATFISTQTLLLDEVRIEVVSGSIDELRIASTFAEVVGVPEPTSMAMLMVAAGIALRGRCRSPQ